MSAINWALRRLAWLMWQLLRLPIYAVLRLIGPLMELLLPAAALASAVTAVVLRSSRVAPDFPFWSMMAFAVACILILIGYYALLRFFGRS